jgi:hypothetical protein
MPAEQKKAYQKPVLERVVLVPQENVLAVCHSVTGSGDITSPSCQASVCYYPVLDATMP